MAVHYPVAFVVGGVSFYCIWYTNGKDAFVTHNKRVMTFSSEDSLRRYVRERDIGELEGCTELNVDHIAALADSLDRSIDCDCMLDFWNSVADLASSVGVPFYGEASAGIVNSVYRKLFYGCNVPTMKGGGEEFIPRWSEDEFSELLKVMRDGIAIVADNVARP